MPTDLSKLTPDDADLVRALALGDYQTSLIDGTASWTGSDLTGKARQWASRYHASRNALVARLRGNGFIVAFEGRPRTAVVYRADPVTTLSQTL